MFERAFKLLKIVHNAVSKCFMNDTKVTAYLLLPSEE